MIAMLGAHVDALVGATVVQGPAFVDGAREGGLCGLVFIAVAVTTVVVGVVVGLVVGGLSFVRRVANDDDTAPWLKGRLGGLACAAGLIAASMVSMSLK